MKKWALRGLNNQTVAASSLQNRPTYAQVATSPPEGGNHRHDEAGSQNARGQFDLRLNARHPNTMVYENVPAPISQSVLEAAFQREFGGSPGMYSLSAGGRHFAFEIALDSETELSTIIATPLKVLPRLSSLTACYLPTAEELKNYQVLRVSHVPPFEDASRLRDFLKPLFEPYGEILEIEPVFFQNVTVKIKTGGYLVNFKLADLDKPVPNSLECTARNSTFPLIVRLDGKTNPDGCYFCHSPRYVRRTCPAASPCRFCQSRLIFWVRYPQRKEQHPSETKPQARSHNHREFTPDSSRTPLPETTISKPRWNLGPIPTLAAFIASLEKAVPRGHTKTTRSISTPSRARAPVHLSEDCDTPGPLASEPIPHDGQSSGAKETLEPPLTSPQNSSETVSSQATYVDDN
ncbi:hypothetical protein V1514DRAFT_337987, partial [Lipomyces japonicus]|uniref:uncharacterized protein n=1 Tax=Lipomyces japonicus TaxID=56871 RepID=UPI0034CE0A35